MHEKILGVNVLKYYMLLIQKQTMLRDITDVASLFYRTMPHVALFIRFNYTGTDAIPLKMDVVFMNSAKSSVALLLYITLICLCFIFCLQLLNIVNATIFFIN